MSTIIRSCYARSQVFPGKFLHDLLVCPQGEIGRYRCFVGHIWGNTLPALRPDLTMVTMVREPVEATLSWLHYQRMRWFQGGEDLIRHGDAFQPLATGDWRLCVDSPAIRRLLTNRQSRFLGTTLDLSSQIGRYTDVVQAESAANIALDQSTKQIGVEALYANAHRRLEEAALVGVTERFAESATLLCRLLGISAPKQWPQGNLGRGKTAVDLYDHTATADPELIERIRAINGADQVLYEHANALLDEQLGRSKAAPSVHFSLQPRLRRGMRSARHKVRSMAGTLCRRRAPAKEPTSAEANRCVGRHS